MKWILNIMLYLCIGYAGYAYGVGDYRTLSDGECYSPIDVDIGINLQCTNHDLEVTDLIPTYYIERTYNGKELPTVTIVARRHSDNFISKIQNKKHVTYNQTGELAKLETSEPVDIFIVESTLDEYVTSNWVNKTA